MNRFPTVHCDLRLIQIEFCVVVQAQFFPFLEDEAVSVIAEEIQNVQVKQQQFRID